MRQIIFAILWLCACCSCVTRPHQMPAPDRVFIHDNPQVGDFALYYIAASEMTHRFEVHEDQGDHLVIRYRMAYTKPAYKGMAPKEWYYRKILRDGTVVQAWAETDGGKHFDTPVAMADQIGGFEQFSEVKTLPADPMQVRAGTFPVTGIHAYIYRTDVGMASTKSTCMEYYSDKVPFRILKREMLHIAEKSGLLKTLEFVHELGKGHLDGSQNFLKLYNIANQKNLKYQSTVELMEYGFADGRQSD